MWGIDEAHIDEAGASQPACLQLPAAVAFPFIQELLCTPGHLRCEEESAMEEVKQQLREKEAQVKKLGDKVEALEVQITKEEELLAPDPGRLASLRQERMLTMQQLPALQQQLAGLQQQLATLQEKELLLMRTAQGEGRPRWQAPFVICISSPESCGRRTPCSP